MSVMITGVGIFSAAGKDIPTFLEALKLGKSAITFRKDTIPQIAAYINEFDFVEELHALQVSDELKKRALKLGKRAPFSLQTSIISALEAVTQAHLEIESELGLRTSVIIGGQNINQNYVNQQYAKYEKEPAFTLPNFALRFMDTDHVGVLSALLQIKGEGFTVGGASASGNMAIIQGFRQIQGGHYDRCLVIGTLADLSPIEVHAFINAGAMYNMPAAAIINPSTVCRPFDELHAGFVYGQASGCILLESSEAAMQRGGKILAELAGGAIALDANHLPNPNWEGEQRVMAKALDEASLSMDDIDYINTHGTSSPAGDRAEINALEALFGDRLNKVYINATKAITGHCLWSAGVVEAIATILQMNHQFVHPNIQLDNPISPAGRWAGKMAENRIIKAALSNSFGFGGINTSIVLKKA